VKDLLLILSEKLDVPREKLKFHPTTKKIIIIGGKYIDQVKAILEELGF
jgi:hypothetical protein